MAVGLAALLAGSFFLSFWGRNAEGLGRHDAGLALAFSFAVPLLVYAGLAFAAVALAAAVVARRRHRPAGRWLAALALALLPVLFLFAVGRH